MGTTELNDQIGESLNVLQEYYKHTAARRGWGDESARDTLLLMTEELGELARSVRKQEGLKRDGEYSSDIAEEIADIQLYLVHLANILDINIGDAVVNKEIKNEKRFQSRS